MPETTQAPQLQDPRTRFPRPPFPEQQQPSPGDENALQPPADHGVETYKGYGRLQGRAALITGADSGIGRAVAVCFAKEGADILFTCLPEEQKNADETVKLIEGIGRRAVALPGDVRQKSFCEQLVQKAVEEFGHLEILVNNAAFQRTYGSIQDISEDEFDTHFRTNVYAPFFMTQAALKVMKPGGVILNTVSIESFTPAEQLPAYAATKAALASLTSSFAKMAMKQGVRVNGVAPGPVWTPFIPSTMPADKVAKFGSNSIFERPAQPVEEAAVYAFLASDDASYVSGEIYGATGGRMPL
jgi:NAD(P)-dependent dehydrogenase (short-subunit alcohol dehydrogenase family)